MYPFLETIRIESGFLPYLHWHQKRMNETLQYFYPHAKKWILQEIINQLDWPNEGKYKLRLLYGPRDYDYQISPYSIQPITTIRVVEIDHRLNYHFKLSDRGKINALKSNDKEILMVSNSRIYDSSIANVILLKDGQWYTPKSFLLNGTTRQRLLASRLIQEADIRIESLIDYEAISFVNAMIEPEEVVLDINHKTIIGI